MEIDVYVPDSNFQQYKSGEYEKEEHRYHYTNFKYDSASDSYACPEGKRLTYWKTRTNKTDSRQWNHMKFNVGYRNFLLRGLEKVRAEFKLLCIGWNLKKMLKLKIRPATV